MSKAFVNVNVSMISALKQICTKCFEHTILMCLLILENTTKNDAMSTVSVIIICVSVSSSLEQLLPSSSLSVLRSDSSWSSIMSSTCLSGKLLHSWHLQPGPQ